ncbi:MAG: hypothetical protein EAZ36_06210 [Verrucomicrobia bacterium]|nr:MAG: hypothetical protein EAZ36_06210 [Verrucomicrobiota bacterium]
MGREAEAHAVWRGVSGAVKAYLERDGIILRGEVRCKLRRGGLRDWRVEGDDLCLRSEEELLVLTLGAKEALAWVRALERPVPGLAAKAELARIGLVLGARGDVRGVGGCVFGLRHLVDLREGHETELRFGEAALLHVENHVF